MTTSMKTIAAITTPLGEGGIGVIHVSGHRSLDIVNRVFRGKRINDLRKAKSNHLYYGIIRDETGIVDEVIVCVFRSNHSFTGTDAVEINCHGGVAAVRKTFELIVQCGAEKADWNDVISQSVEQGEIDFIQREALIELPNACTKLVVKVLIDQYTGCLSHCLKMIYKKLNELFRHEIDAADGIGSSQNLTNEIVEDLNSVLSTSSFGIGLCSPRRIAVIGKPNVGKSTLVNALIAQDRTIVHPQPGTTRDPVTELIEIRGIPYNLADTAGIRKTSDQIESLSVEEAKRQITRSDIILIVFDNTRKFDNEDKAILHTLSTLSTRSNSTNSCFHPLIIPIINKNDEPAVLNPRDIQSLLGKQICHISALRKEGFTELENRINEDFVPEIFKEGYRLGSPVIFTLRQKELITAALNIIEELGRAGAKSSISGMGDKRNVKQKLREVIAIIAQCLGQNFPAYNNHT